MITLHTLPTPIAVAAAATALAGCAASGPAASATTTPVTTATAPATVSGAPSAEAAWEALMGRDGEYAAIAAYTAVIDRYCDKDHQDQSIPAA